MKYSLKNAVVAGTALLAGAFAGRMSERAQRGGFTEGLVRSLESRDMSTTVANTSQYRFYNDETKKFFVESLPEIPQSFMTEMYAGCKTLLTQIQAYSDDLVIPIDKKNASRALYYVFTPTVGKEPVDEVTIWLNGGPGCSSLEGFFQENGRIIWSWGMYAPEINPYAWS